MSLILAVLMLLTCDIGAIANRRVLRVWKPMRSIVEGHDLIQRLRENTTIVTGQGLKLYADWLKNTQSVIAN